MSMKITQIVTAGIATLALIFSIVAINQNAKLGGTTNYDTLDVTDGYLVDGTTRISGTGAATFPSLTVTTTNSATSTTAVGCIQTTATSTGSPIKLVFGKVGSSATTTLYGDTSVFAVYGVYGNCP